MDTEWQALMTATAAAWPEDTIVGPTIRPSGRHHWQASIVAPIGEIDATAVTPEAALAALTARIGGDPYQLKVAVRQAETAAELARLEAEAERVRGEVAAWTARKTTAPAAL